MFITKIVWIMEQIEARHESVGSSSLFEASWSFTLRVNYTLKIPRTTVFWVSDTKDENMSIAGIPGLGIDFYGKPIAIPDIVVSAKPVQL